MNQNVYLQTYKKQSVVFKSSNVNLFSHLFQRPGTPGVSTILWL